MRPHVLYITPIFGYPPIGGPRLRTYNTLLALARCAECQPVPDPAARYARPRGDARRICCTFLRDVVLPDRHRRRLAGRSRTRWARRLPERRGKKSGVARTAAPEAEDSASGRDPAQVEAIVDYDPRPPARRDLARLRRASRTTWCRSRSAPACRWSSKRSASGHASSCASCPSRPIPPAAPPSNATGAAKEAEERFGALHADVTTAVSDVDAAYFEALAAGPDRVMQIANVIDVDAYQPAVAAGQRCSDQRWCSPGRFSRGTANVDATAWLVDEVMPRVWARRPDAHLYLVGRDPAPEVVARKSQRVHVTGEVASIVPYLRGCVATLVPLRWESGTRFKILEAFACRAPVISTTLGAEGLAVTHEQDISARRRYRSLRRRDPGSARRPEPRRALDRPSLRPRSARLRRQLCRSPDRARCSIDWGWARP